MLCPEREVRNDGIKTGESYPYGIDPSEKKRITAIRGHKLLKDKRDELMRQYLDLVRENMEVRKKWKPGFSQQIKFVIAKAGMSEAALNTALMAPKQGITLTPGEKNIMSVNIPTFAYQTRTADEMIFIHMGLRLHPVIWTER